MRPARSWPFIVRRPVGTCGARSRTTAMVAGLNEVTSTRSTGSTASGPLSRSATATATRSSGSKSGSWRSFLISMFTPMPAHAARASVSVGNDSGRSSAATSTMARPSGSTASWCTVSRSSAVRRASSSTQSAPRVAAWRNASTVFSGRAAEAPRWPMTSVDLRSGETYVIAKSPVVPLETPCSDRYGRDVPATHARDLPAVACDSLHDRREKPVEKPYSWRHRGPHLSRRADDLDRP